MSKPRSTLPNPVESDANLTSALAQIGTEVDDQPLRSSALARIMRETFHGSDAGGAWDWRMAYDMMQAAAIQVLLRGAGATADIANAKLLASRLLTETRRSEQQIRLQQFSTPLPFAALALRAAAVRKARPCWSPRLAPVPWQLSPPGPVPRFCSTRSTPFAKAYCARFSAARSQAMTASISTICCRRRFYPTSW
ncbi:hypothetical protein [Roseovarius sp. MS2]|uniref:hypothetical protein n=1 Tax=Roseovarius sp. MS2 TaxID=3390728 RepID=UPI003F5C0C30